VAISVVQSIAFSGAWSGSFGSNVAAGNTVYLFGYQYTTGGATMGSSNPEFAGSAVGTATQLISGQGPGVNAVYGTLWQLPGLAGGAASVALTNSGGTVDGNVGMIAIEVSGLGAAPVLDAGATPNPETGNGTSSSPASGSTGDITTAPELILALAVGFGIGLTLPGGAWSGLLTTSDFCAAGWQVAASSGGSYSYAPSGSSSGSWFAGVAALEAATSAGVAGTVQPAATLRTARRSLARAVTGFVPVRTVNTGHGPAGTVQPLTARPAPRRVPARAYVRFTPVTTVNAPAPPPKPQHGTPPSDEGRGFKRWLLWGA
jgi:hypothetical protein